MKICCKMMLMDWIISKINKEFENKFFFLFVHNVVYNKANKTCCVNFLFPEDKNLSDEEKEQIKAFVEKELSLNAKVVVKFKKSYLDENLILDAFFKFLGNSFPSVVGFVDKESAKVEKTFNQRIINLKVDEELLNYIDENTLKNETKKELEKHFLTEIFLNIQKEKIAKEVVIRKVEPIKKPVPRFQVKEARNLFGGEISPNPEFIKNVKGEKTSVILAGKIENFEKKSYEIKKGKRIGQTKNYFAFVLNDTTARIEVRYFTTQANEKHMDKLVNGDEVLILGNVEEFNKKLTLYVSAISRCYLPEKIELKNEIGKEYEAVEIEAFSVLSQENLFDVKPVYNQFIERGSFVVFDVETTGLNYETDELLEIGAVKIENGKIVSKFQTLIKPKNPIPPSATAINNITDSMVESCPKVDVVIRDFYRYCKGSAMVGYNVSFDQKFVVQAGKPQGIVFDNEFVDVMPLAKNKLRLSRYKLVDVVKRLGITLNDAHRAYADALATAEAFLKLNSQEFA